MDFISGSASGCWASLTVLFKLHKGNVYKLVLVPAASYLGAYVLMSLTYDYVLNDEYRRSFESIAKFSSKYSSSFPVGMLLGFFTTIAMNRWFAIYNSLPGTSRIISILTGTLKQNSDLGKKYADMYSRLTLLAWALTFDIVCEPFRQRFGDLEQLRKRGLLSETEQERLKMENQDERPLVVIGWMIQLLRSIQKDSAFSSPADYGKNLDTVLNFKKSCTTVLKFYWKNIPLGLLQTVAISVYMLGITLLMTRDSGYFPLFHLIQFFLYFSWLKFGHMAANPFGDDDDDIDICQLFDCHIRDARRLVEMYCGTEDELIAQSLEASGEILEHIDTADQCDELEDKKLV